MQNQWEPWACFPGSDPGSTTYWLWKPWMDVIISWMGCLTEPGQSHLNGMGDSDTQSVGSSCKHRWSFTRLPTVRLLGCIPVLIGHGPVDNHHGDDSQHLQSFCCVQHYIIQSRISKYLILITTLQGRYFYPNYADEKTKAMWFRVTQWASSRAPLESSNLGPLGSKTHHLICLKHFSHVLGQDLPLLFCLQYSSSRYKMSLCLTSFQCLLSGAFLHHHGWLGDRERVDVTKQGWECGSSWVICMWVWGANEMWAT